MKRACTLLLGLFLLAAGRPALAAEPPPPGPLPNAVAMLSGELAGKTLSAVTFVPHLPGTPGGGQLTRLMLQAYLSPDGRALLRVWDPTRNSYTFPTERRWSLSGTKLCLDLPAPRGPVCADVHVWGPRIAGIGVNPYAMLDGDLKPGNWLGTR